MPRFLTPLVRHFDTRTLRERVLLIVATAALIDFVIDFTLIQPGTREQARLRDEIAAASAEEAQMQAERARLQAQLAALAAQGANRTDRAGRAERADTPLADAEALAGLVRQLALGGDGVSLESMRALAPRRVDPGAREGSGAAAGKKVDPQTLPAEPIYQHSVEFVLSGSYLDLLAYLREVEALPLQLYWGDARLAVSTHPRASLTAVVHAFSPVSAVAFR